jgi:hypothetical protein
MAACSRKGAPKHVADGRSRWYSRPRENPSLFQGNGHDILGREQLEFLMTRAESRRANEDRHRPGSTDRAVIPLDAKISYEIQQSGFWRACGERLSGRRFLIAPLGHFEPFTAPRVRA